MKASVIESIDKYVPGFKLKKGFWRRRTIAGVYEKNENYVIYEIAETNRITYSTVENFKDNVDGIAPELDGVESYLGENKKLWKKYKNTMAEIYSSCLQNDIKKMEVAEKLLSKVSKELDDHKKLMAKVDYIKICLLVFIFCGITSTIVKTINYLSELNYQFSISGKDYSFLSIDYDLSQMIYCGTFGALGGLFSVAVNIDKYNQEVTRLRDRHIYLGGFRIVIALLSGLIIYLLVESQLVLGFIRATTKDNQHYLLYLLAIGAGLSQNLVSDLMAKTTNSFDTNVNAPTDNPSANSPVNTKSKTDQNASS